MRLILVEGPTAPVVSLDDMKAHLNVGHDRHNALIEAMTAAATADVDGIAGIGRALVDQTWDMHLDGFCSSPIEIPLPPLIEVESIKYYDDDNAQQTLAESIYEVVGAGGHSPAYIALKKSQSWPSVYDRMEPVTIRFRAGYVDTSGSPQDGEVPAQIVAAIKLITGTYYLQRETIVIGQSVIEMPWAAKELLSKFRVYSF